MNNSNFCNNCGNNGHYFYQCKKPITSIGIIAINYEINSDKTIHQYLMICRKDSLGYIEFIRGKYPLDDIEYIKNIINEMTMKEKNNLLTMGFKKLWDNLWGNYEQNKYKNEFETSLEKFNLLKKGLKIVDKTYVLDDLIGLSDTKWEMPEWGFPKGRRNYRESDINCGKREFFEETGFSSYQIQLIENIIPYEEIFTGSNLKSYKHKYFIAVINKNNKNFSLKNFQKSEVCDMKLLSYEECLQHIRPYNLEKIKMLNKLEKTLNNNSLIY